MRSEPHVVVLMTLALLVSAASLVFPQGAALEATPPGSAPAGSTVIVKWSGPNGPGDFITVVRKGARPNDYLDYRQTSDGRKPVNPVTIVLPAEPGAYELRYVRGNPRSVLTSVPYEVTAITATLEGPALVAPGARFEVAWMGPNNSGDWVTIVASGAAVRRYGSYVDARNGRADDKTSRRVATLQAPKEPGRYELRYVQQGTRVIGTRTIEVGAATSASSSPLPPPPMTVGTAIVPGALATAPSPAAPPTTATAPPATLDAGLTREHAMTAGAKQAIDDANAAAAAAAAATSCKPVTPPAPCVTIAGPTQAAVGTSGSFTLQFSNLSTNTVTTTFSNQTSSSVATSAQLDFTFDVDGGSSQNVTKSIAVGSSGPITMAWPYTFQSAGVHTVKATGFVRRYVNTTTYVPRYDSSGNQIGTTATQTQVVVIDPMSVKRVVNVTAP